MGGRIALLAAVAAAALVGCGGGTESGPAAPSGYRFVRVASGFDQPVHVTAPRSEPGRLYVVEQTGRIRIVRNGRITGTLLDIRSQVACCGEQGLLSVAFHPRYARNRKYYVDYTDRNGDTRVVEYRGRRRLRQILFVDQPYSNHNGGQLVFRPGGRLYVGMGGGGSGGAPQNPAENLGRSPGLENYGWDVYEGRARFERKSPNPRGHLVFPIVVYSLHGDECAVTGGFVYRGSTVPSARGRYFYGDNCSGAVWTLTVSGGRARGNRREAFSLPGLSSFGEDAAGELYAVTLNGRLWRLR